MRTDDAPKNPEILTPIPILLDEPIGGKKSDGDDSAGLGFGEYADVLAGVILGSASPFTMGVFGDWGSGKSTLMRMIETRMEPYTPGGDLPADGYPTMIPVWFDAWRYERETDLIGPLLGAMLDAAQEHDEHPNAKLLIEALGTAFRTLVASVKVKLPVMEVSGKEFVEQYDRFVDRMALPGSTEYRRAYRILQETIEEFATPSDKAKPKNKFVVFVDDLDRCLPEAALQVLECTKVFLGFKGMVWVLGLKQDIIENCIKERYRSKAQGKVKEDGEHRDGDERFPYGEDLGKQYLQKIIQVPFTIPVGTPDEMALLPDHFAQGEALPPELDENFEVIRSAKLSEQEQEERDAMYRDWGDALDLPPFQKRYHIAAYYLERKPRELKRLLNAYIVSSQITRAHFRRLENPDEEHDPMLTLALLVLRSLDDESHLYDYLTAPPHRDKQDAELREAARVLNLAVPETGPEDVPPRRKGAPSSYGRRPDADAENPDETETPSKRGAKEHTRWVLRDNAEEIAEFLLVTRLLEADPKDIEAHARATSAAATPDTSARGRMERFPMTAAAALRNATCDDFVERSAAGQWLAGAFGQLEPDERARVRELARSGEAEFRSALAFGLGEHFHELDTDGRALVDRLGKDREAYRGLIQGLSNNPSRGEEGDGLLAELLRRQEEEGEEA